MKTYNPEWRKAFYERLKAQGVCVLCRKKTVDQGHVMCGECMEKARQKNKREYEYFKTHGICVKCHKNAVATNHTRCPECLEKDMLRGNLRDGAKSRASDARRRERLKSAGLCTHCGQREARPGHVECSACASLKNRRQREARVHIVIPPGICARRGCDAPVVDGMKTCAVHHQEKAECAMRMQEIAKARGTWRKWDMGYLFPRKERKHDRR